MPATPDAPLFFTSVTQAFTKDLLVSTLRDMLMNIGIQGEYSGHSFRRGAATLAKDAGIEDMLVQILGRWKSEAYKKYIDTPVAVILEASRRLQLAG